MDLDDQVLIVQWITLLVEGNPFEDISAVRKAVLVMKGDTLYRPDELYEAARERARSLLFSTKNQESPYQAFYYYQGERLVAVRSGRWKLMMDDPQGLSGVERKWAETKLRRLTYSRS